MFPTKDGGEQKGTTILHHSWLGNTVILQLLGRRQSDTIAFETKSARLKAHAHEEYPRKALDCIRLITISIFRLMNRHEFGLIG